MYFLGGAAAAFALIPFVFIPVLLYTGATLPVWQGSLLGLVVVIGWVGWAYARTTTCCLQLRVGVRSVPVRNGLLGADSADEIWVWLGEDAVWLQKYVKVVDDRLAAHFGEVSWWNLWKKAKVRTWLGLARALLRKPFAELREHATRNASLTSSKDAGLRRCVPSKRSAQPPLLTAPPPPTATRRFSCTRASGSRSGSSTA
jgi:hypothetical protein